MRRMRQTGFLAFVIVWVGQVVSLIGTGMTRFALTIWAWQITGQATALGLVGFFSFAPSILMSPVAGALVDRWNRKLAMMISDLAAVLSSIIVLILFSLGKLQIWHLYVTGAFTGIFQAFQFPAYSAAITMMVSKEHYSRASGMLSMAEFGSTILAPILAVISLNIIGIAGILVVDIFTFLVAIGALLPIFVPQPSISEDGHKSKRSLWKESVFGFNYIFQRPSLLGLQLILFSLNLVVSFAITVFTPLVLSRTGNDTTILGILQTSFGLGGMAGGIVLSIWGGPKQKIHGVLMGMTLSMLGMFLFGLGRGPYVWALAGFLAVFFVPFINGSNQAIWQSKVPPEVQGRVFATRALIAQVGAPVSMLLSGPLADNFFEPGMMPGGSLAAVFGNIIGTGPGAGMSLMFTIAGLLGTMIGLGGYAFNVVRKVEDILPDHPRKSTDFKNGTANC